MDSFKQVTLSDRPIKDSRIKDEAINDKPKWPVIF